MKCALLPCLGGLGIVYDGDGETFMHCTDMCATLHNAYIEQLRFLAVVCAKTMPQKSQTLQELRMLSTVTFKCQVTKIVMNSGSQLSEL